jgi:hypothetical protein
MRLGIVSFTLALAFLAAPFSAEARQTTKIARIEFLDATSAANVVARIEAFRQRRRDIGYEEGKNIVEVRARDQHEDRERRSA